MADDNVTRETTEAPIGRVRVADPAAVTPPDAAPDEQPLPGWSASGVGVALLVLLIMIGALVIILWAAFQTRL